VQWCAGWVMTDSIFARTQITEFKKVMKLVASSSHTIWCIQMRRGVKIFHAQQHEDKTK
jgi:hypothetical protein